MAHTVQAARQFGLTAAEKFWYVLGCIFPPGLAYLAKVPVARALSELDQFRTTEHVQLQIPQHGALPGTAEEKAQA